MASTLDGMAAKDTGAGPFNALKPLLAAVRAKRSGFEDKRLGSVPVNVVSEMDISGSNAGVPVMDAQGSWSVWGSTATGSR